MNTRVQNSNATNIANPSQARRNSPHSDIRVLVESEFSFPVAKADLGVSGLDRQDGDAAIEANSFEHLFTQRNRAI
jgi:hypothetical protein